MTGIFGFLKKLDGYNSMTLMAVVKYLTDYTRRFHLSLHLTLSI
jgi:hypothetical protein